MPRTMLTPLQQSLNCKELDFPGGSGSEASTARGMGSIPGQGTKSPHAIQLSQKTKRNKLQVTRKSSPSIWLTIQTVFGTKGSISNELSSKPDVAGPGIRQ